MTLLLLPHSALAHSGHVALAYPVEGITIDGDFSDWPEHLPSYPIEILYHVEKPANSEDLSASFQVAYNLDDQALYFVFDVTDDHRVANPSKLGSDSASLRIYVNHDAEPKWFFLAVNRELATGNREWGREASTEGMEWEIKETENGWQYELKMVSRPGSNVIPALDAGKVLSVSAFVYDIDHLAEDFSQGYLMSRSLSSTWMSWSSGSAFFPQKEWPGDVVCSGGSADRDVARINLAAGWPADPKSPPGDHYQAR